MSREPEDEAERDAWLQGAKSAHIGRPVSSNPFTVGTKKARLWAEAWRSTTRILRKVMREPEPAHGSSARESELEAQLADADRLAGRMARILGETAAVLKGEPAENHLHGWHDLPEVARRLRAHIREEHRKLDAALAELRRRNEAPE
jgi:hypothetical protein